MKKNKKKKTNIKQNNIIIIITLFLIALLIIFLLTREPNNILDNILKEDYQIYSLDCDGTTNMLDKKVLKDIKSKWNKLSNNGPYLGDFTTCYKKVLIDHNEDIFDIEIIDTSSIIVKESKTSDYYTYYTNADILIEYLNNYFN